jgi:hypothetical protein
VGIVLVFARPAFPLSLPALCWLEPASSLSSPPFPVGLGRMAHLPPGALILIRGHAENHWLERYVVAQIDWP